MGQLETRFSSSSSFVFFFLFFGSHLRLLFPVVNNCYKGRQTKTQNSFRFLSFSLRSFLIIFLWWVVVRPSNLQPPTPNSHMFYECNNNTKTDIGHNTKKKEEEAGTQWHTSEACGESCSFPFSLTVFFFHPHLSCSFLSSLGRTLSRRNVQAQKNTNLSR